MHVELWGGPLDGESWHTDRDMPPVIELPVPMVHPCLEEMAPAADTKVPYRLAEMVASPGPLPHYVRYRWVNDA